MPLKLTHRGHALITDALALSIQGFQPNSTLSVQFGGLSGGMNGDYKRIFDEDTVRQNNNQGKQNKIP